MNTRVGLGTITHYACPSGRQLIASSREAIGLTNQQYTEPGFSDLIAAGRDGVALLTERSAAQVGAASGAVYALVHPAHSSSGTIYGYVNRGAAANPTISVPRCFINSFGQGRDSRPFHFA